MARLGTEPFTLSCDQNSSQDGTADTAFAYKQQQTHARYTDMNFEDCEASSSDDDSVIEEILCRPDLLNRFVLVAQALVENAQRSGSSEGPLFVDRSGEAKVARPPAKRNISTDVEPPESSLSTPTGDTIITSKPRSLLPLPLPQPPRSTNSIAVTGEIASGVPRRRGRKIQSDPNTCLERCLDQRKETEVKSISADGILSEPGWGTPFVIETTVVFPEATWRPFSAYSTPSVQRRRKVNAGDTAHPIMNSSRILTVMEPASREYMTPVDSPNVDLKKLRSHPSQRPAKSENGDMSSLVDLEHESDQCDSFVDENEDEISKDEVTVTVRFTPLNGSTLSINCTSETYLDDILRNVEDILAASCSGIPPLALEGIEPPIEFSVEDYRKTLWDLGVRKTATLLVLPRHMIRTQAPRTIPSMQQESHSVWDVVFFSSLCLVGAMSACVTFYAIQGATS